MFINQVSYALVGGYAVALHGAVRGTIDIDFVIHWNLNQLKQAQTALNSIGLVSRLPISAEYIFNNKDQLLKEKI